MADNKIVVPSDPPNSDTPGSWWAIQNGCLCPAMDNGGGVGRLVTLQDGTTHRVFWINELCPFHGNGAIRRLSTHDTDLPA